MTRHAEALAALDDLRRGLAAMTSPNPRGGTTSLLDVYAVMLLDIETRIRVHERGARLATCESPVSVTVTDDGVVTRLSNGGVHVVLNEGEIDFGLGEAP